MRSRLNLYNYPKCLILFLLYVASNIYKQHSYFPQNLSSWCITTSASTISDLMFRSLPDPGKHLLESAHCAMAFGEPSVHVRVQPELCGYSNLLWGPCKSCFYNEAQSGQNSHSCHFPCWLNCNYRTIKHIFSYEMQNLFFKFCKT